MLALARSLTNTTFNSCTPIHTHTQTEVDTLQNVHTVTGKRKCGSEGREELCFTHETAHKHTHRYTLTSGGAFALPNFLLLEKG